ncbi:Mothers against decapentaplegic [Echinococcus granulosus]|uniref:Mothers against decapentaplegic homolog n=1 Tax=Echinococcus granulosus TaxID=6210 RepID=W6UEG8_ECHGR|nr:Mothers against decapentaplegic [Echinococcus granulosus]EUB56472.1 Mothers against decapentaplegic [Echinococcus granulosus]
MVLDATTACLSSHSMVMKILGTDHEPSHSQSRSITQSRGHLAVNTSTSSDACMNIVHSLMCHRKGGESEEFSKFAIESLIKKLKDRRDELDALIAAVTSNGATQTSCVTIQRTLDSRMQIAGRKCFPHLIYARLWRWSDAHKTELRHLPFCHFGFDKKLDWVCVNPYHYERTVSSALDISSLALSPPVERRKGKVACTRVHNLASGVEEEEVLNKQRRHSSELQHPDTSHPASTLRLSVQSLLDESPLCVPTLSGGIKPEQTKNSTIAYEPAHQQQPTSTVASATTTPNPLSLENVDAATANLLNLMQWVSNANATFAAAVAAGGSGVGTHSAPPPPRPPPVQALPALHPTSSTDEASAVALDAAETAALLDPIAASGGAPAPVLYPSQCSGGSGGTNNGQSAFTAGSSSSSYGRASQQQQPVSSSSTAPLGGGWGGGGGAPGGQPPPMLPPNPPPSGSLQPSQLTTQRPPEYWCNIAYFELDQQVGELFKVPSHYTRVIVDGYTDPSSRNRFCLGQLSNVHRSEQSEKSRLYIGKGVELDIVGEGDVWIRCLSEFSIFVQSYYLDREAGRAPGDAVHKIYPGAYIKVSYSIAVHHAFKQMDSDAFFSLPFHEAPWTSFLCVLQPRGWRCPTVFDIRQCHEQMRHLAHMTQAAAMRQAAAVAGSMQMGAVADAAAAASAAAAAATAPMGTCEAAGVGVDDFRRLCNLRLSFVKGWGPDYPRHDIKETPCWIEIQLHRPLQLLDEVLQAMPLNDLKPTRHFFYYQNQLQQPPQHLAKR